MIPITTHKPTRAPSSFSSIMVRSLGVWPGRCMTGLFATKPGILPARPNRA